MNQCNNDTAPLIYVNPNLTLTTAPWFHVNAALESMTGTCAQRSSLWTAASQARTHNTQHTTHTGQHTTQHFYYHHSINTLTSISSCFLQTGRESHPRSWGGQHQCLSAAPMRNGHGYYEFPQEGWHVFSELGLWAYFGHWGQSMPLCWGCIGY
jgi:hypothetical protein